MSTASSQTLAPALSDSSLAAPSFSTRLASLDIFRGATIAMMLLVNNPGSDHQYDPLEHAPWHGWTPTDLVFPFFLYIMGVAIPFSMAKRSGTESKKDQLLHVLARGLSLFLLGEFGYSIPKRFDTAGPTSLVIARWAGIGFLVVGYVLLLFPWKSRGKALLIPPIVGVVYLLLLFAIHFVNHHAINAGTITAKYDFGGGLLNPDTLRIPGVLQRIGVCYIVAGSLAVIGSWHVLVLAALALMAGYSLLMAYVPYPSLVNSAHTVKGLLERDDNFARYIDTHVLGRHVYSEYPDPEGIVSTLPAIGSVIIGILVGMWLRAARPAAERCAGLLSAGVLVLCAGGLLNAYHMPINKRLWTPAFTVFCGGAAMLGLGMVFYLADVLQHRKWGAPFKVYGMNAIAAFVLSGIVGRAISLIKMHKPHGEGSITVRSFLGERAATLSHYIHFGSKLGNESLAYAVGYVLFFLVVMWVMYLCKIFLKV